MHHNHYIHRDIKLEILLLGANNEYLLADFGTTAHHTSTAPRTTCTGTPLYMAPEIMQEGHAHDKRADNYSIGKVLYELFVGINKVVGFKKDGTISWPKEAAAIPQAAKTLIAGMLKKKEDRISLEDVLKNPFLETVANPSSI